MKRTMAWDTETFPFGPGKMAPPIVVSGWYTWDCGGLTPGWEPRHWQLLKEWLEAVIAGKMLLVGHNIAYDFACAMAGCPDLVPLVFAAYDADGILDTMLRQKLIDIAAGQLHGYNEASTGRWVRHGYTLDGLALRLLGETLEKGKERTTFGDLYGVDISQWPEGHRQYALGDPIATWRICQVQEKEDEARNDTLLVDQHRQAKAALALQLASVWGIRTDKGAVQALYDDASRKVKELTEHLVRAGLVRQNGSRDMRAIHARMESAWPGCPKTDKKKVPQINAETCKESGDPLLMYLSKHIQESNVLHKDCKELAAGTVLPIHTSYNSLVNTGRTSSSGRGKGGDKIGHNIQNVKCRPGIRECYTPREGKYFCSCDYAQIEMCTLAQVQYLVLGHSALGEAIKQRLDPHLLVAATALGITYEQAKENKKHPEVKLARQYAKPVNFGLAGGMGLEGLLTYAKSSYGIAFTEEQAQNLIDVYHTTWWDMQEYFDWVRSLVGDHSTTIKHLFSNRQRGGVTYTTGCNSFFQALAADMAKAAMWAVCRACYAQPGNPLYGCRIVNFVHDELILEVPTDPELAHAAAMELERIMVEAAQPWCPDVPIRAEAALMHRWSKSAEPVHNDQGLLVPWEPERETA